MHPRLRKGTALASQHRWAGMLAIGLQRAVAHIVANPDSADLMATQLESGCFLGALTMASPMFCMLLRAMWKEHVGLHFSAGCDYW